MKTLMICTKYPIEEGDTYLTNDLANALADCGHEVTVFVVEWSGGASKKPAIVNTITGSIEVISINPFIFPRLGSLIQKILKWTVTPISSILVMKKILQFRQYDVVVGYSPAIATGTLLMWAIKHFRAKSYLVLWDFFPFYHVTLGRIPKGIISIIGKKIENYLIKMFDVIGVMSPENVNYFVERYDVREGQLVEVLNLWGKTDTFYVENKNPLRVEYGLPTDRPIAVVGGQLMRGGGVEDVVAAAKIAKAANSRIFFLFVGSGDMEGHIHDAIKGGLDNVKHIKWIPRETYLEIIACCDVGLVCNDAWVNVPTFASKTIDYLRAGLPIVASHEACTDFGDIVVWKNAGLSIVAGQPAGIFEAINTIVEDHELSERLKDGGKKWLIEDFSPSKAARQIISAVKN